MILKISMGMLPLILSLNAYPYSFQETQLSFNSKEAADKFNKFDSDALASLKMNNQLGYDELYLKNRVENYVKKWEKQTKFSSDPNAMIRNKNFQSILALQTKASPIILNILKHKPSNLVWALNFIYDKKISTNQMSIEEASKAWVRFGQTNHII
ncbi:MAG: hypothetical protein EOO44_22700 [Flavobacterium sp.]|nr:MAG: hypothetical protein EOO44_22700 [Flavobacterium sp.]